MRRLFSILLALALFMPFAFTPTKSHAGVHGGFWAEIQGHGGEILNIVVHGDHLAFNRTLETIQSTAENFSHDDEVVHLLSRMDELNADYENAISAPEDALMDTSVPEHYGVVHPMHNMAAALAVRLTDIAPQNPSVIAMNSELRVSKEVLGTDALCGVEAVGANGTLLSDSFWDMVNNATTETHWEVTESIISMLFFPVLFLSLFLLMAIGLAPQMMRQQRKALTT